jgi:hypothetical protein
MAMSGKKTKPPTGLKNIVVLRGTEEWKKWLDELAEANSAPLTVTIEQALKDFAEKLKVRKPPRRVP